MRGSLFQDGLLEGEVQPRVHAYYFKQVNEQAMSFHHHESTEIMYMISGVCRIDIESGKDLDSLHLKKGEFILLDANVSHRIAMEEDIPCRMLNVEFGFERRPGAIPAIKDLIRERAFTDLLAVPFTYSVLRDPDEVYHVLKSLVLELDGTGTDSGMLVQLLFGQLLLRVARLKAEASEGGMPLAELYVKRSLEFLRQNYDRDDIRVKEVAAAVSVHPGYLQRIFKAQTGKTITEQLTELRMEKAKILLRQTDIPVSDISGYVGVASRQYFHQLFKKYTGLTPVEYRGSGELQKWSYSRENGAGNSDIQQ
ncbi:AraC family transcriptional regulator [Gorillibacterium massiliense]|uniref:AraC family transcriptional regulator n=1 Tax=Gorillibacterium massiliense TaxID=1280390 RepID=UPI0004AFDFEE|nr:AraC family transcriptional regulator [Gorillibacterium massiliense]